MKRLQAWPVRSLFLPLGADGRRRLVAATAATTLERVVAGLAAVVYLRRPDVPPLAIFAVVTFAFFARAGLRARLRLRVRVRMLESLSQALVAESPGITEAATRDAEFGLMDGLYAAEDILSQECPGLVGDAAACGVLLALLIWSGPLRLLVDGCAVVLVGGFIVLASRRVTAGSAERIWDAFVPALDNLSSAIHGRLEILTNGASLPFLRTVSASVRDWERRSRGAAWIAFLAGRLPLVGAAAVAALLLYWHGDWRGANLGSAALLVAVTAAFAGATRSGLDLARDVVRAGPVIRVFRGVDPSLGQGGITLPAPITWDAVSFAYPGEPAPTLQPTTAVWQPSELLALSGHNGSGKSTFLRVLLGLHAPTSGRILAGSDDLAHVDRTALRNAVGYLAQRPFLPDRMSVREALQLIAPDANDGAEEDALKRIDLWPVLLRRAAGAPLDVKLGALSAGEKQRVAIARVLLREASLLVLDEPDANLDVAGVQLLARLLREEAQKRMVIFAAHDAALLAAADRVLHFEGGRLSERTSS